MFSGEYSTGSHERMEKNPRVNVITAAVEIFWLNVNGSVNKLLIEMSVCTQKHVQHGMPFTRRKIVKKWIVSAMTTLSCMFTWEIPKSFN